jgi:hypothetical protein
MKNGNGRTFWRTSAFLIVGSLIQYILFHVANLFKFDAIGAVLSYATYYYDVIWEFLSVALAAIMMTVSYSYFGYKRALTTGAVYAAARACYFIPYGYILSIGYGYDSLESLLGGIIIALIAAVGAYLASLISMLLAILPAHVKARRRECSVREVLSEDLPFGDPMDVSLAGTAAVGIISLVQFTVLIAGEIADTVDFFAGNSSYTTNEVLYVVFKYFFAILLLTGVYFLLSYLKRYAVDEAVEAQRNATENKEI